MNGESISLGGIAQSCAGCKFFLKGPGVTDLGECRRNPPTTIPTVLGMSKSGEPDVHRFTTYAMTPPHGWCGEYRPKVALS